MISVQIMFRRFETCSLLYAGQRQDKVEVALILDEHAGSLQHLSCKAESPAAAQVYQPSTRAKKVCSSTACRTLTSLGEVPDEVDDQ